MTRQHFDEFVACYGDDSHGSSERTDQGERGRFRSLEREEISKRGENLDISWLRDENAEHGDELEEPEVIAAEIMQNLKAAMDELKKLESVLGS